MKQIRKRFTIPADLAEQAEEYATATNRTFSEFICEAATQHINRYPVSAVRIQNNLEKRVCRVEEIIRECLPDITPSVAPDVPAGTQKARELDITDNSGKTGGCVEPG